MSTLNISFKNLTISAENVRTVSPSKEADRQLIASIRSQGLLQNLIVISAEKKGIYEVVGGGRRFAAISFLVNENHFTKEEEFPCILRTRDQATEVSISENLKESMHPADEFMAYKKMADQGKSEKEIALRFGHSLPQVRKLLRLASVESSLIDLFKQGKLSLETVMAFTITSDHEKQLACFKELGRGQISAHSVRRFLTTNKISSEEGIVKFVSLASYKKAGGTTSTDLFESKTYLNEPDILTSLAEIKLNESVIAVKAEGWKWVEISLDGDCYRSEYSQLRSEYVDVPQSITNAIKKAQDEQQQIYDLDEWTDEATERSDKLDLEIEALETEKEQYRQYIASEISFAGCIITFDNSGNLLVLKGFINREDHKSLRSFQLGETDQNTSGSDGHDFNDEPVVESAALAQDLSSYYAQAFQAELIKHEDLCFDLLIFQLTCSTLNVGEAWNRAVNITCNPVQFSGNEIDATIASKLLQDAEGALDLSWAQSEEISTQFADFCALKKREKVRLMAFCVSRSSRLQIRRGEEGSVLEVVKGLTNFSLNNYWKPTETNYFSRVNKATLLEIGETVVGAGWSKANEKFKKGELAKVLPESEKMQGWLPKVFH